jgi:glycosyltransferase involved in cell wall biosynthesis
MKTMATTTVPTLESNRRRDSIPHEQLNVVVLTNFLRKLHVDVFEEVQRRVGKLTLLLSTPMEPDRHWDPVWGNLDVVVQKNWTLVRKWRHSAGFAEDNFIHLPYDTISQLKRLKPDVVVSFELGFRTLLASHFAKRKRLPLIAVGNMSEAIEQERGWGRRQLRKLLIPRVDCFTYNGPSCRRYLESLGIKEDHLAYFQYFYDRDKVFQGAKSFSQNGVQRILFSGNLTKRKGIASLVQAVSESASRHPERTLTLRVCGAGPEEKCFQRALPENLQLEMKGASKDEELAASYGWADICLFPSLADEWGLVPIEAFASGCPVVGSRAAQSMEVYGKEGDNGWFYSPSEERGLERALERALATTTPELGRMSQRCRETVEGITAEVCAGQFCAALDMAIKNGPRSKAR